jgi:hypothetical protein
MAPKPTAPLPSNSSAPLRALIVSAAEGHLGLDAFISALHAARVQAEQAGPIRYRSKEEARLIWDMLWALEFYSPDPAQEAHPEEWNDARAITAEIQRVALRLTLLDAEPKHATDPRFATFPRNTGLAQLRWYIRQAAEGAITIREFLADFRNLHEQIEAIQRPAYASKEEAQAIWNVLWAAEYCSLDITQEDVPEDWCIPEEVLMVVKQAAPKLAA